MNDPTNMFWDSCVFIRYITGKPAEGWSDLDDFIRDAQSGKRRIYFSTIALVEVLPRYLKDTQWGTVYDFFEDMQGAFYAIDPTPDILIRAGELRDVRATNPSDPKATPRVIGTPDSIHLMTCLYVRDVRGISDIVFHTFDNGKGKNWEGKCIPLLSFERWYPDQSISPHIANVCGMERVEPRYPQLRLGGLH